MDPENPEDAEEVARTAQSLWDSAVDALPVLAIALGIVVGGWVLSRIVRIAVRWFLRRRRGESFALVMSTLAGWVLVVVVVLAALAVTFPSVRPVDLLAGLGFFSVAVGFAFKDILENTLSGVLLLFRQPFRTRDQIEVQEHLGTVEAVTVRETRLRTFDGRLVVIPNRDVYKDVIVVQTDEPAIRWEFDLGVAYGTDLAVAVARLETAVASCEGVLDEPPPFVVATSLSASSVVLTVRYWAVSTELEGRDTMSTVIAAVLDAAGEAGIDVPPDVIRLVGPPGGPGAAATA